MVCEPTKVKAKYKLGVVDVVKTSADGYVRSATIRYTNIQKNPNGDIKSQIIRVYRSVQRLALTCGRTNRTNDGKRLRFLC